MQPVFVQQVIETGGRFQSRFLPRFGRFRIVDQAVLNPELGITPAAADTAADTARKSHTAAKLFRRQNARDQKAARLQIPPTPGTAPSQSLSRRAQKQENNGFFDATPSVLLARPC